jgi:hypothetical protein
MELGTDGLVPLVGDEVLRQRFLPEGLELTLLLEGEAVQLVAAEEDGQEDQRPARIFLLSSGEMTPFELRLQDPYTEVVWVVTGALTGAVTVQIAP